MSANDRTTLLMHDTPTDIAPLVPPSGPAGHADVVADGAARHLDPAFIRVDALSWWITTGVIGGLGALGMAVLTIAAAPSTLLMAGVAGAWLVVVGLLVLGAVRMPPLAYARCTYSVSELGIEIRSGVVWRRVISVPRSRIQHTDVVQGPLMRRFGLATLTIHTAGTHQPAVAIQGLAYADAIRIRDFLVRQEQGDAADGV